MIVKILGISGSPRKNSNTEVLVKEALKGVQSVQNVEVSFFPLAGKKIGHCLGCLSCKKRQSICTIKDDFQEFFKAYMEADGIIIGSPVYHLSITSCLKAAIDRLGQSLFSIYQGKQPRFCKVGGAIAQGNSLYGGQEFTLQFIINSFILMNSVVVSGNRPQSKIGVPLSYPKGQAQFKNKESDPDLNTIIRGLGQRVAEMAHIIQTGLEHYHENLGPEYSDKKYQRFIL